MFYEHYRCVGGEVLHRSRGCAARSRQSACSIIRPIADRLDADFLHYLLISKPYKDQLLQTGAKGGSTRQAITKAQIQDFWPHIPKP